MQVVKNVLLTSRPSVAQAVKIPETHTFTIG